MIHWSYWSYCSHGSYWGCLDHRVGVGDGRLGLEVGRTAVVNYDNVRLDHFMDNTDGALVTVVVVVTVVTLLRHNHRAGSPPYNMTNFMANFNMSLWLPDHDNLLDSASMVSLVTIA